MTQKPDISKFSWAEAFSSPNGKTSIPLICGFAVVITGCIGFGTTGLVFIIMTVFTKTRDLNIINGLTNLTFQSGAVIAIGATFLGIRRFTPEKQIQTMGEGETEVTTEVIGKD